MAASLDRFSPRFSMRDGAPRHDFAKLLAPLNRLAAAVVVAAFCLVPKAVALSAIAPAFILLGACVAAYARLTRQPSPPDRVSAWDVAGLYVFLGFMATVLANPDHVALLF